MPGDKERIIEKIRQLTSHRHIKLTNCCNSAILLSLIIAKKEGRDTILIPDQGGWLTYQTFPTLLGLKTKEIKTDFGLLNLKELEKAANSNSALIINSLAGYIAPQPLGEIARICKSKGCLLIEDASGSIGQEGLCDGNHSDILVCSFGKWKPINLEYGGFISTNRKEYLEMDPELFQMTRFSEQFYPGLLNKLEEFPKRVESLQKTCQKIKSDLKDMEVIHRGRQGLNVIIKFRNGAEKEKIINYCKKNNYQLTVCPRYIRVMDNAISIEVKRL
jgi:hypothetical protein